MGEKRREKKKKLSLSPAGLPAPGEAPVHNVVGHQEECLEPLDAPAESVGFEPRVRGQGRDGLGHRGRCGGGHDRGDGVGDGEAAVELASGHVEVEHASGIGGGEIGLGSQQRVCDELVAERGVDGEELLQREEEEVEVEVEVLRKRKREGRRGIGR